MLHTQDSAPCPGSPDRGLHTDTPGGQILYDTQSVVAAGGTSRSTRQLPDWALVTLAVLALVIVEVGTLLLLGWWLR